MAQVAAKRGTARTELSNIQLLRGRLNTAILDNNVDAVDAVITAAEKAGLKKKLLNEPIDGDETALMMTLDVCHDDADPKARAKIIKVLMKNGANPNCQVTFAIGSTTHKVDLLVFALRRGDAIVRKALVQSKHFDARPSAHGFRNWDFFTGVCENIGIGRPAVAMLLIDIGEFHRPGKNTQKIECLKTRLTPFMPGAKTRVPRKDLQKLAASRLHRRRDGR